jgi:hypothetical protein
MSDHAGPGVDPTNPNATLRVTSELIRGGDFVGAERLLAWALDFRAFPGYFESQSRFWDFLWRRNDRICVSQ